MHMLRYYKRRQRSTEQNNIEKKRQKSIRIVKFPRKNVGGVQNANAVTVCL